jgi:tetratricopeptide (TPR) repeat protein
VAKKKSSKQIQDDLRQLSKPNSEAPAAPTFEWKKTLVRAGGALVALWAVCAMVGSFLRTNIPLYVAAAVTVAAVGVFIWLSRMMKKQQALTQILASADTEEGRKQALEKLGTDYKKDDAQAALARAQLQMQDDPKAALATLEAVDLDKQMAPVASQIRAMRAMLHLTMGEPHEAKKLVDKLDLSKQQDAKVRAMFATVAGETWARTGQAQKALDTLELYNPESAEHQELRVQMWRARAYAYAALNDTKGIGRALRKLVEMNPQLLGMFVGVERVHPLLEREAKQLAMRSGIVPRQQVRMR